MSNLFLASPTSGIPARAPTPLFTYRGPQAKGLHKLREISSDAISLLASTFRFWLPLFS